MLISNILYLYLYFSLFLLFGFFVDNRETYIYESVGLRLLIDNSHLCFLFIVLCYISYIFYKVFNIYKNCVVNAANPDWYFFMNVSVLFCIRLCKFQIKFLVCFLIFMFALREIAMIEDYLLAVNK